VSHDEQDVAEALDSDAMGGSLTDEELIDYPPDRPLGVEDDDVTPVGEDRADTIEERAAREEPDAVASELNTGREPLDDDDDHGIRLVADERDTIAALVEDRPADASAEEAAVHVVDEDGRSAEY